jgi:manganese transport protein
MAGQVVMQGFLGWRIPVWLRRAVTMIPAFVVVALGYNATESLILSQVVLSVALPVPMVALLILSRSGAVMGRFRLGPWTTLAGVVAAAVVLALNTILLLQTAGVRIPGLPA